MTEKSIEKNETKNIQSSIKLIDFVKTEYPREPDDTMIFLEKTDKEGKLNTYRDFALALSQCESEKYSHISVEKSSTWAVCQEFLGNLKGYDLGYAQSRGGIWHCSVSGPPSVKCKITSVREILTNLSEKFPET